MNLSVFPVYSTNIFPLANDSKQGGQLMTEYNLTSRESVNTWATINYRVGPSFCHSRGDFRLRQQTDGSGKLVSNYTLEISAGRAIVNGHYIESLQPVVVDMLDLNAKAKMEGTDPLKGRLCIGLRAMYSTKPTMAGAMLVNNTDEMYEGIQVVVLPEEKFKLPEDTPNVEDKVTAHLKLGSFNFTNGMISTLDDNYPARIQNVSAERISNIDDLVSGLYLTKTGLNPKKHYVFSGKGSTDDKKDTWCEANDALMIWDRAPQFTNVDDGLKQAGFAVSTTGQVVLAVPHKQIDGMTDTAGNPQYYKTRTIPLPVADFIKGTPGTVNRAYTNHVKDVVNRVNQLYKLPNGKQIGFISELNWIDSSSDDRTWKNKSLPQTFDAKWSPGDFILVNRDNTTDYNTTSYVPISTFYAVGPGYVTAIKYVSSKSGTVGVDQPALPDTIPGVIPGMELEYIEWESTDAVNTSDVKVYGEYFSYSGLKGTSYRDYFRIRQFTDEGHTKFTDYYYVVTNNTGYEWYGPYFVTGQFNLATTTTVGGFLNVEDTDLDNGYVYLDADGHLVLLDYALLRSGVLAYQLGQDYTISSGLTAEEMQGELDDYVNQRVAFPNSKQLEAENPKVINLTIDLTDCEEDDIEFNIKEIDSRFGTAIYLHILGEPGSNVTINIADCEKIRIDPNIGGAPKINLYRCNLYYDAYVLSRLKTIEGLKLWYERFSSDDANLLVDNMTVREVNAPVIPDDLDYWNEATPNDNHYMFALQSLTFGSDGSIIGAGLYVKNETSANISEGKSVISSKFVLPQGAGLIYPKNRLTKRVKITGSFVNAYSIDAPKGYMVLDTNFTALTDIYDEYDTTKHATGTVAFYVDANAVTSVAGLSSDTPLDCWESNAFHVFQGAVIG